MKVNPRYDVDEAGFTLIELMITTVIGMVVLAGVSSMFVSNTRLATSLADRTERLGDLYISSHIMQAALRNAQASQTVITQGPPLKLAYTPVDSICVGYFEYKAAASPRTDYIIRWHRPEKLDGTCNNGNPQELIRNLPASNGMAVVDDGTGLLSIDLSSNYENPSQETKTVSLSFKVWSRN